MSCCSGQSEREPAFDQAMFPFHFENKQGMRIRWHEWAPPAGVPTTAVLFLAHGVAEHAARYDYVAIELAAKGVHVYAHDHQGHGGSEDWQGRATFERFQDLVDDQVQFVNQRLRASPAHAALPRVMFGHSMGSIVAIGAYLAARDLFSGLMVSGSCLYPSPEIKTPLNLFLAKTFSGVWPTMNAAKIVVDDVSLNVAFRQSQLRDPLMHHGSLNVRWGHEMLLANARFTKSLPELTGPVRCIHGSADKVTLLEGSKLIMRRAVNAKRDMYTFAGKYHDIFSHRDVFEDAVALVLDFVHEVSNGAAGVAAPSEVKARHVDRQCPPAAPATPAK